MNMNDKEKDQLVVTRATTEREITRVVIATRVDTVSEEKGWYCISLICNAILPFV